jgi:hypothetical protein
MIDSTLHITMVLNQISFENVSGYYISGQGDIPIKVAGTLDSNSGDLQLTVYDSKDLAKAKIIANWEGDNDLMKGFWIDSLKTDSLPIYFEGSPLHHKICKYAFTLKITKSGLEHNINVDMPELRCDINSESYNILYKKIDSTSIYIIIKYTHASRGCKCGDHYCGCGIETGLILIGINKQDYNIDKRQNLMLESCWHNNYCQNQDQIITQIISKDIDIVKMECDELNYMFDKNRPEQGFATQK